MERSTYIYRVVDGCEIGADVYKPDTGIAPFPTLLWIHGGSLMTGSKEKFAGQRLDQLDRFIAAGYAVAAVDYRLAPQVKVPEIVDDIAAAYRWVMDFLESHLRPNGGA